nr:uncharacterized protein LOC107034206 [Vicugna pacos]
MANSPALSGQTSPSMGTEPTDLVAPVPWKRELGRQCPRPGSKLPPVPSEPGLWAQPVSTFCKPCTQQAEPSQAARGTPPEGRAARPHCEPGHGHFPQRAPHHTAASLSQLLWGLSSPQPFLPAPRPSSTSRGSIVAWEPSSPGPGGRASSSCCRERRVSPRQGHPGPAWAATAPGGWSRITGQHVSQDRKRESNNRCPTTPCQARTHRHRRGDHRVTRPDLPQAQDGLQLPLDWLLQLFLQRLQRDTLTPALQPTNPPTHPRGFLGSHGPPSHSPKSL